MQARALRGRELGFGDTGRHVGTAIQEQMDGTALRNVEQALALLVADVVEMDDPFEIGPWPRAIPCDG